MTKKNDFERQPTDDLRSTYGVMLSGGDFELLYNIKPYCFSTDFCGVMVVPPLPQCKDVLRMTYLDEGKEVEGEWPIYFIHYSLCTREEPLQTWFG